MPSDRAPDRRRATQLEQRRARAARRRRGWVLSVDAIVTEALRIIDEEGVDAVSMRRVAAEFDTGPASLYAHVANKEELLQLVLDRVIDEVEPPTEGAWQEVLRTWVHQSRDAMLKHSDLAKLTFAHIPSSQRVVDSIEVLLSVMIRGGVPPQVATWALDILSLYMSADAYEGWLLSQRFDDGSGRDPEELGAQYVEGISSYFSSLSPERYPYLVGNLDVMMAGGSDNRFAFGVDMIIAGIAAQVPEDQR